MNFAQPETQYPFLEKGGDMGLLTRQFDWSTTPVGDPGSWPTSLRTIVSMLLNSRFPMFLWWGDEMIQFYNDAYRPSLGNEGKHPKALGQKGEDCWPEIWPVIKPLIDQVKATGEATWLEDQLIPIYRNGKLEDVYWTFSYSTVKDDDGSHGGILVVCVETTDKVIKHAELQESEDQLRFAIDAAELGTWDYDPLTNKFTANQRLKDWFGLTPDYETDLTQAISRMVPEDQPTVTAAIQRALIFDSGGHYESEFTVVHPLTGNETILRAAGKAWFNDDRVAYRLNGTLQDVTGQVQARRKLELEEERTRLALEAADLGTFMLDMQTDELQSSRRMREMFGVEEDTIHPAYLTMLHEDDLPARNAAHVEAIKTGIIQYEARMILKNGLQRWIKVHGRLYKDAAGNPQKMMGIIQDNTEAKELEQHKDNFLKLVSHELKTPLTSMLGYAELLTEKFRLMEDPESVFFLTRMKNQVVKLNTIVQDLLDVSRVEGDKIIFREERFYLPELIKQIADELEAQHPTHVIELKGVTDFQLFADKERLSQVMTNLLTNAIKYSPESSTIIVNWGREGAEFLCSVQDFGIGIAPENHAKIFELFFQEHHETNRYPGLGIGLYLTAEIIRRQRGKIWLESTPGEGTTFYFSLPLKN